MKEKMYLVKRNLDVMFVSDKINIDELRLEAQKHMQEEVKCNGLFTGKTSDIVEITEDNKDQIPKDWRNGSLLWGTEDEITPYEFFEKQKEDSEEYNLFLRLKNKYEGAQK